MRNWGPNQERSVSGALDLLLRSKGDPGSAPAFPAACFSVTLMLGTCLWNRKLFPSSHTGDVNLASKVSKCRVLSPPPDAGNRCLRGTYPKFSLRAEEDAGWQRSAFLGEPPCALSVEESYRGFVFILYPPLCPQITKNRLLERAEAFENVSPKAFLF